MSGGVRKTEKQEVWLNYIESRGSSQFSWLEREVTNIKDMKKIRKANIGLVAAKATFFTGYP